LLLLNILNEKQQCLVIGGDGQCDSPGHMPSMDHIPFLIRLLIKYWIYNFFRYEMYCVYILNLNKGSNEVEGSYHMEKEVHGFLQGYNFTVDAHVTDQHKQINKWLQETHPDYVY